MAEESRTLEQMNAAQKKTIIELTEEIKTLKIWERFAAYLLNDCDGQTISEENLANWLNAMLEQEADPPKK